MASSILSADAKPTCTWLFPPNGKCQTYGTRPHSILGYSDSAIKEGGHGGQAATIKYSAKDIRFTRTVDGTSIYVFLLRQPESGSAITIKHLGDGDKDFAIGDASQLNSEQDCDWKFEQGVLYLSAPKANDNNAIATVFKVALK